MIKFLILLIIFVVMIIFKFIVAGIGTLSVAVNKRGTFINFGLQYLKQTRECYARIAPYMGQFVDDVLLLSQEKHYALADETEFIESVLYKCVAILCPEELPMVRRPQSLDNIDFDATFFTSEFLSKYNIKN